MFSADCVAWNFTISRPPTELERANPDLVVHYDGQSNGANGLRRCSTAGTGDTGDTDTDAGCRARSDAFSHRARDRLADGAVLLDERRRNTREIGLRLIAVTHDAAVYVLRAARYVGQARREQSAGARLGHCNRHLVLAQQIPDDGFEASAVGAVHRGPEDIHQLQPRPRRARRPRRSCAPPAPSDEARSGRGRRESSC
jgi:hypothetical protein